MNSGDRYERKACKEFEEDLVLYYYGEWEGEERDRVENHLRICKRCEGFLQELSQILAQSPESDEPPQAFWEQYSREMHEKLAVLEEEIPWWKRLFALHSPWMYGAVATAFGLILSLVLAFGGGKWLQKHSSEEPIPQEIQAVSGELEFLESMDLIEVLDLLEAVEPKNLEQKSA